VTFELTDIFRYDDDGRLAEEWIQTDSRLVLLQLGADAT
jgi:antibiotic biosynthesis monooxygenase (ABM) superfamily enzyme